MRTYIFDIDGTLADLTHRLPHIQKDPKDWPAFFAAVGDDEVIPHMLVLVQDLARSAVIVYVSGRSDECRDATLQWLMVAGFPAGNLFMRKAGDHRPDYKVKVELLAALKDAGHIPVMAFDDRNSVVKMWRELGVPCAQVAEGDF